jgi:hypothetical protein
VTAPPAAATKEQCIANYPETPGHVFQRQKCLNDVVTGEESTLSPPQKAIVSDCSVELLKFVNQR